MDTYTDSYSTDSDTDTYGADVYEEPASACCCCDTGSDAYAPTEPWIEDQSAYQQVAPPAPVDPSSVPGQQPWVDPTPVAAQQPWVDPTPVAAQQPWVDPIAAAPQPAAETAGLYPDSMVIGGPSYGFTIEPAPATVSLPGEAIVGGPAQARGWEISSSDFGTTSSMVIGPPSYDSTVGNLMSAYGVAARNDDVLSQVMLSNIMASQNRMVSTWTGGLPTFGLGLGLGFGY